MDRCAARVWATGCGEKNGRKEYSGGKRKGGDEAEVVECSCLLEMGRVDVLVDSIAVEVDKEDGV